MNKNIIIAIVIILILAILGLGLWYWYWLFQRVEIVPTPAVPTVEESAVGDTTGVINQELEGIDVNGLDPTFKEIDAELENL